MKSGSQRIKTLFLLRHAKSSWKDETLADFERPLNARGKRAATMIGRYLRKQKVAPDLILSSTALRARETTEIILRESRVRSELRHDERIYEAGPIRLLEVITQVEDDRKTVLLVGHNPGMEELLLVLTGQMEVMPTAALAKIVIKASKWKALAQNKGTLEWVVRPKELEND